MAGKTLQLHKVINNNVTEHVISHLSQEQMSFMIFESIKTAKSSSVEITQCNLARTVGNVSCSML